MLPSPLHNAGPAISETHLLILATPHDHAPYPVIATPYVFIMLPTLSLAWYLVRTRYNSARCAGGGDEAPDDDECAMWADPEEYSFFDAMWETWGYQADPGTHADGKQRLLGASRAWV